MSEINQRVVCNGVDFQSIQNTNFKTMRISVHFMLPIDKNHISANAVLPALLCRASKQYPDYTKLSQRLPNYTVQASMQRCKNWGILNY